MFIKIKKNSMIILGIINILIKIKRIGIMLMLSFIDSRALRALKNLNYFLSYFFYSVHQFIFKTIKRNHDDLVVIYSIFYPRICPIGGTVESRCACISATASSRNDPDQSCLAIDRANEGSPRIALNSKLYKVTLYRF